MSLQAFQKQSCSVAKSPFVKTGIFARKGGWCYMRSIPLRMVTVLLCSDLLRLCYCGFGWKWCLRTRWPCHKVCVLSLNQIRCIEVLFLVLDMHNKWPSKTEEIGMNWSVVREQRRNGWRNRCILGCSLITYKCIAIFWIGCGYGALCGIASDCIVLHCIFVCYRISIV